MKNKKVILKKLFFCEKHRKAKISITTCIARQSLAKRSDQFSIMSPAYDPECLNCKTGKIIFNNSKFNKKMGDKTFEY